MRQSIPTIAALHARTRVLAVACVVCLIACGAEPSTAPVLGTLPDFTLVDQDTEEFGSEDLRGNIWIADFVFTRCPDMCPMLTSVMARVQRQLTGDPALKDVRLVSISVDPEHDTPARLATYAEKHGADRDRWAFLTGPRQEIWLLSRDGFRLAV